MQRKAKIVSKECIGADTSLQPSDWASYLAEGPVASASFMEGLEDLPVQKRKP